MDRLAHRPRPPFAVPGDVGLSTLTIDIPDSLAGQLRQVAADQGITLRSPDLQDFNVTPARKNGAPTYGRRSGGELVASGLLCSRLANGAQRSGIYYETNS